MGEDVRNKIRGLVSEFSRNKKESIKFVPGKTFIQYSGDVMDDREINAVIDAMLDGRLAMGKRVEEFEKGLAAYLNTKNAATVSSGSDAVLIALATLKNRHLPNPLKNGEEVITCGLTFATSAGAIIQNGFKPVFVDAKLPEYTIDENKIEDAISDETRAILAVHIFGNACNMDKIMKIAKDHGLFVIEDCADALGTSCNNKKVGSIGDMGAFSFYPAHQMTTMEGGAISTNDDRYNYIIQSLRSWGKAIPCPICGNDFGKSCKFNHNMDIEGMESYDPAYLFLNLGFNSKLIEVQGAFGVEQLKRIEEFNKIRKENFKGIMDALKPYEDLVMTPKEEKGADVVWYSVPITLRPDSGIKRKELADFLRKSKIEFRYLFTGNITNQPAFRNLDYRVHGNLANADLTTTNSLFVGCYQGITKEMRNYIIEKIVEFLDRNKN